MTKLIFLDRDGVLIRFPGRGKYVIRDSQMKLIPRAAEAVAFLTRAGYEIHVISNQGCVSHGMITQARVDAMTKRMLREIRLAGGRIKRVHYCPHQSADGCRCKKPQTLMLRRALEGRRLVRRKMVFVGDSVEDIGAGKNFGCRTVLVLSGRNKKRDVRQLPIKPDFVKKNLWDAVQWLTKRS